MLIASRLKNNLIDCDLNTTFNYLELKKLSNEKILGVYEDQNFVWNNHFQYGSKKYILPLVIISNKI